MKVRHSLKICALLGILFLCRATPINAGEHFPIIGFHDVVDFRGDRDEYAVTVDRLIAFFDWMQANHWKPITLDDVEAARRGEKPLPPHPILITFDDGYQSLYTRVFPLLLAYRIPVVVALVGKWVDAPMDGTVNYEGRDVPRRNFLSPEEICEMMNSGLVEFASHSYDSHRGVVGNPQASEFPSLFARRYTRSRGYESEAAFRQRIHDDLVRSREIIAGLTGREPRALVWPFGRYNNAGIEVARKLGFEFGLTLDPEPADVAKPMSLSRYIPSYDPSLATVVSNLNFEDPLPAAHRLVALDPATLWTGNAAESDERLGHSIERLRTLGATHIVLNAFVSTPDGRIAATWFPNTQLPVRADFLSRIAWQIETRAGIRSYIRLPASAAMRTLGSKEKVRALFHDLGVYVPAGGLFVDDAPGLAHLGTARRNGNTPWEIRDARNALRQRSLPNYETFVMELFRRVEYWRPGLQLVVLTDPGAPLTPSAIADLTLLPISPGAAKQMKVSNWLTVPLSRRIGLWFTGPGPPSARDLISATRRFQQFGGTTIGWSVDDPIHDQPNATVVAPTVSAAKFPEKF